MRTIKFRGKVNGQWWYVSVDVNGPCDEWEQFWSIVDGSTVGQFTGLTSCNGREIYEGDIIKYLDNTSQGLVEKTVVIEDIRHLPDFICSQWQGIIGNIYETPISDVRERV